MILSLLLALLQAGGADPQPRWLEPSEVHRMEPGADLYGPTDLFRTRNGHIGVLVYAQAESAATTLRISEGDEGPWTTAPLPAPQVRLLHVDGNEVEFLCRDAEPFRWRVALEGGKAREVRKTKLRPPHGMLLQHLLVDGETCSALLADVEDFRQLFFARSADGGSTWDEAKDFGRTAHRGSLYHASDLLRTPRGLHHVVLAESGEVTYRASEDGGKTWTDADLRSRLPADANPDSILGLADGRTIHLVVTCWKRRAREEAMVLSSRDEGRTWGTAQTILKGPIGGDLAPFYSLRGSGDVLAFSATDPSRARIVISRDGGRSWKEEDVREGLRWGSGLAATWVDPGGTLRCAVTLNPGAGGNRRADPRQFVLLRAWDVRPSMPPPLEGGAREEALESVRRLGDEDFAVRQAASAALRRLGGAARPILREALKAATDPEVKDSLKRLLPPGPSPEWWVPIPR